MVTENLTGYSNVDQLIEYDEKKIALLKEWRSLSPVCNKLADESKLEASDAIDDRRIEIESELEDEFGIEIDSFGNVDVLTFTQ
jgi:hypothetical protein